MIPSILAVLTGRRPSHIVTFPFHKVMDKCWKRWQVLSAGDVSRCCPISWAILLILRMPSSFQPPRVSITRGTKVTPTAWHSEWWATIFFSSPTFKAWPHVVEAPNIVRDCRVEITVTSRAADRPLHQFGRKTSAGMLEDPGIRAWTSLRGARAADWTAVKRASRRESCLWIRSPFCHTHGVRDNISLHAKNGIV